jgi:polyhydroxyalkanoate synthase
MPKKDKSTEENQSACDPENVEQLTKDMLLLSAQIQQYLMSLSKPLDQIKPPSSLAGISKAFLAGSQEFLRHPEKINQATEEWMKDYTQLWQSAFDTSQSSEHVIDPTPGDKRFKDPLWEENPSSALMMRAYLLYARWVEQVADDFEGLDEDSRRKIKFYSRQFVDAIAPSNFAWANPSVLKKNHGYPRR